METFQVETEAPLSIRSTAICAMPPVYQVLGLVAKRFKNYPAPTPYTGTPREQA